jgi:hypothetical protein
MTRRERLLATLRGLSVDRPAVSFYEINGWSENPDDPDPFNIYAHPSWRPLIDLARHHTDCIVMRNVPFTGAAPDPLAPLTQTEKRRTAAGLCTTQTIRAGSRVLTRRTRRDCDINTVWTEEHLLKDTDDLQAYLELPLPAADIGRVDPARVTEMEARLGDAGIVMINTADPLCAAAALFDMATYTVIALTEPALFRRLLDRFAATVLPQTEAVAQALPGRLWRIVGPEYASPPYLPPALFREYVCAYVEPMVRSIQNYGGYARIHSHGNLRAILDDIAGMRPDGLDPIEPPPQGDVELAYVRRNYGRELVLFGNLEASDIENLPTPQFAEKIRRALDEGTAGAGRGFVLMPSACPYGRVLSPLAMKNYEKMVELVGA